jgi:hypothetical protein
MASSHNLPRWLLTASLLGATALVSACGANPPTTTTTERTTTTAPVTMAQPMPAATTTTTRTQSVTP